MKSSRSELSITRGRTFSHSDPVVLLLLAVRAQPSCEVLPVLAGAPLSEAGHEDVLDGGRCGPAGGGQLGQWAGHQLWGLESLRQLSHFTEGVGAAK